MKFHSSPVDLYFKKSPDYLAVKEQIGILEHISAMKNESICLIDFYKHQYAYVSQNHLFLCGYSLEELRSKGEVFFEKILYKDDIISQLEMKDAAFLFFSMLDRDKKNNFSLFTTHRLKHKNGSVFGVLNQFKPIAMDDKDNVWLVLCLTNLEIKNFNIETYIEIENTNTTYFYSPCKKKFEKRNSNKVLTNREQIVLSLAMQGFTTKEIAIRLHISISTVKSHKQNILGKFNVHTIPEAALYAHAHNLLKEY